MNRLHIQEEDQRQRKRSSQNTTITVKSSRQVASSCLVYWILGG
jgi:hypothetical protein